MMQCALHCSRVSLRSCARPRAIARYKSIRLSEATAAIAKRRGTTLAFPFSLSPFLSVADISTRSGRNDIYSSRRWKAAALYISCLLYILSMHVYIYMYTSHVRVALYVSYYISLSSLILSHARSVSAPRRRAHSLHLLNNTRLYVHACIGIRGVVRTESALAIR